MGDAAMGIRYGKPCMTNLEPELGRRIIETILSTPVPDNKSLNEKADEILAQFLERKRNAVKQAARANKMEAIPQENGLPFPQ